jgi:hypothetical protein
MCRTAQTGREIRNAIAALNHLPDGFFLEFQGKSLCAHKPPPMLKG